MAVLLQAVEKVAFRPGIQGGSGLVQNEDAALAQQGPGYRDPLGLALAEPAAGFPANRIQSLGEFLYEMSLCHVQDFKELVVSGIGIGKEEVVPDGAAKKRVPLWDEHEVPPGPRPDGDAFYRDGTARGGEKP